MRSRWLVGATILFVFLAWCGKLGYDRWQATQAIEAATARELRRDAALDQLVEMKFREPVTLQEWLDEFTRQTKLVVCFHDADRVIPPADRTIDLSLPRKSARQTLLHLADHERFRWTVGDDLAIQLYSPVSDPPFEAWAHSIPTQFVAPQLQRRDVDRAWYRNEADKQLAAIIENRWPSNPLAAKIYPSIPVYPAPGQLIVTNSFDKQLQVRQFLKSLAARLQTISETPATGLLPSDPRLAPLWIEPGAPHPAFIGEGLQRRVSLDVTDEPLHKVISRIAAAAGLRIVLSKNVADAGVHPDMPVTFRCQELRAQTILNRLLDERNLTYVIKDYVPELQVTTVEDESRPENLITLAYPVADLLDPRDRSMPLHAQLDTLVGQDSWNDVGGHGVLCDLGDTYLIAQHERIQRDLQNSLHALRTVKAGERRSMRVRGISSDQERTRELLLQRRELKFKRTPLKEAVRAIEQQTGLSLYITKWIEDAGVQPDTPVTCDLPEAALAENLSKMLQQHHLTYMVQDEQVLITTVEYTHRPESLEIEVFDIRPIQKKCFDSEVRELIWFGVQPDSWDRNGPDEFQGMLIVPHRQDVLEQVRYVLDIVERKLLSNDAAIKTENLLPDLPFHWLDSSRTVLYDVGDLIPAQEIFAGQGLKTALYEFPADEEAAFNESTAPLHVSMRRFLVAYLEPEQIKILETRLVALRAKQKQSSK